MLKLSYQLDIHVSLRTSTKTTFISSGDESNNYFVRLCCDNDVWIDDRYVYLKQEDVWLKKENRNRIMPDKDLPKKNETKTISYICDLIYSYQL